MQIDPKGLEAAREAIATLDRRSCGTWQIARTAITAYLASIQAEPAAWLIYDTENDEWWPTILKELAEQYTREAAWNPRQKPVRPLYAAPVPPAPVSVEMVLAVLERAREVLCSITGENQPSRAWAREVRQQIDDILSSDSLKGRA